MLRPAHGIGMLQILLAHTVVDLFHQHHLLILSAQLHKRDRVIAGDLVGDVSPVIAVAGCQRATELLRACNIRRAGSWARPPRSRPLGSCRFRRRGRQRPAEFFRVCLLR